MKVIYNSPKSGKHCLGSSQAVPAAVCWSHRACKEEKAGFGASCYNKWCDFSYPVWIPGGLFLFCFISCVEGLFIDLLFKLSRWVYFIFSCYNWGNLGPPQSQVTYRICFLRKTYRWKSKVWGVTLPASSRDVLNHKRKATWMFVCDMRHSLPMNGYTLIFPLHLFII